MASEKKAPATKKTSAEQAAELAAKIRESRAGASRLQPGSIVGGDVENWRYVHVPADPQTRDRLEAKLKGKGYVLCTNDEKMVGMNSGRLWKIPRAIHVELMADRHKRVMARFN